MSGADGSPEPFVRPYRACDFDAARDVCFLTGFMGDPVAEQFSDRDAFAHLFCTWYLENRADTCWVVDDGAGTAIGYLIGSPDGPTGTEAHDRAFLTRHLLGRGLLVRPGTARWLGRSAADLARDRRCLHPPIDRARYPADMHIDLLPAARGRGLGAVLVRTWLDRLGELAVPGVHLGTMGQNSGAVAFFETCGFEAVGDEVPGAGFRLPDGSPTTVRWFQRRTRPRTRE